MDKHNAKKLARCIEDRTVMACALCMNDTVIPENMISCSDKHNFCSDCVSKRADREVGTGRAVVECLLDTCDRTYSLSILHPLLTPKAFLALLNHRICEGINPEPSENLVSCPYCSHVTLISKKERHKTLKCLNPLCLEESCL